MHLAVIGSRSFTDRELLFAELDKLKNIESIISGGASGADELSQVYAKERGLPITILYPKWRDENGNLDKGAGFRRNIAIVNASTHLIAFWDGASRGTAHSLLTAKKQNKPCRVVTFDNPLAGYYLFHGPHFFSLDHPCQFTIKERQFGSARHALAFFAAIKLGQAKIALTVSKIDMTKKAAPAKVKEIWASLMLPDLDEHLESLLYVVNYAKFAQNEDLKKFLAETEGEIAWAADDSILGTGVKKSDPALYDLSKWGRNLLGASLGKVRTKLTS